MKTREDLKKWLDEQAADPHDLRPDMIEVGDQVNEVNKTFPDRFMEEIEKGKKKYPGDFFVVRHLFKHQLTNEPQDLLFTRATCEAPTWRQTQWRYIRKADAWEMLWFLPDQSSHHYYKLNALSLATKEEQELLQNILKFESGELDVLCNRMNVIYNRKSKHKKQPKPIISEA